MYRQPKPRPRKSKLDYLLEFHEAKAKQRRERAKDDLAITIGEQIREIRKLRGLSQQSLAQKVGMKQSAVSRLENGEFLPKLSVLKRFANKLKLTIDISIKQK